MSAITCPKCNHVLFNLDSNLPGQAAGATSSPPAAAPSSADQSCKHGARFYKSGTNKSGKPYAGWFCPEDDCKPVWV